MRAVLERREKAAVVRVEELRAEFERVRAALADAEEELNHRVIGLEQYLEALAEQDVSGGAEASEAAAGEVPLAAQRPAPAPVTEPRRTVARKQDGVSVEALGPDYRRIMAAFTKAGGDSVTARQAAVMLGWDPAVATRVEGARGRLKRLVERGWLVEERPGRFTLPVPGPAAAA
ncbi:hypothetical protein AB0P36_00095 [Streptomyces flavidovirens]